ncbi:MAG: ABC transporter permease [Cellulomonas sp.]|uniref:ABC transporter permease n=1 Tax=Cellulomonas sp. 73-92 TaxID=1895740 RepID=UPI00092ABF59|nr:ABC transporter permease [Cellulomonas sp. 73-92]MBN9374838.1 ABC transporter permease [Cellulomonas sp.]OJV80418.1 MAG: ABC transporter [Cellulomonas sp. 73-92]
MSETTVPGAPRAASVARRVAAQGTFEMRAVLRNGEQVMVTVLLPLILLVGLARATFVSLDTSGTTRIDLVTPGVLAFALMSSAFTSPAISTAFDRRYGVLRLLATTPLGPGGLLAGKLVGVLAVQVVQVVVLGGAGLWLGWRPDAAGIPAAIAAWLLGTAAWGAAALLAAGRVRAEAVIALANLVLVLLAFGGVVLPASVLPGGLEHVAGWLPSGALGEALRAALLHGTWAAGPLVALVAWAAALSAAAARWFRWSAA